MALIFYYSPMSTATVTHAALEELGIPYAKVKVDLARGEQKKPEFLLLNPNGKVPTIVDDDVPVFESLAILVHLGDKYGATRNLWPAAGSPERAHALSWSAWAAAGLVPTGYRMLLNTSEESPPEIRNEAQARQAREEFERLLGVLEGLLARQAFIGGATFLLVDSYVSMILGWLRRVLRLDLAKWPNLTAWLTRCEARPAVAVAIAG